MKILIRFEDKYGCRTLFNYSNSILNNENIRISDGLGNKGVFKVNKEDANNNDYIIIVFDLDAPDTYSLTSEELKKSISSFILEGNGGIKEKYKNKVILIPVFFCFETLYLYSAQFKDCIQNIESYKDIESSKLIKLYKEYYDYSRIEAPNMTNIASNLRNIQDKATNITGSKTSKQWFPQRFHTSYSKQIMKLLLGSSIDEKLLTKHEDKLFNELNTKNISLDIQEIFKGLHNTSYNKYLESLLFMKSTNELSKLTLDNNMSNICNLLDEYNKEILGTVDKVNIALCKSNIESMIESSNIGINTIKNKCRQQGFTDAQIEEAIKQLEQ